MHRCDRADNPDFSIKHQEDSDLERDGVGIAAAGVALCVPCPSPLRPPPSSITVCLGFRLPSRCVRAGVGVCAIEEAGMDGGKEGKET